MHKSIPGYPNYSISDVGLIYNKDGLELTQRRFIDTNYVRLSVNGTKVTVSVNKLLFDTFELVDNHIPLSKDEIGIRYYDTHYYITNKQNCYNVKTRKFLKPIYRNNYISYNLYINKTKKVVYCINYLTKFLNKEVSVYGS